ncbi:hypothetical protein [Rhizobacter fulvus]|jgi:hypothetical protein
MKLLWKLVRGVFRSDWSKRMARRAFMRSILPMVDQGPDTSRLRVLVLGVYLADRPNTAAHLVREFAAGHRLDVEQRWAAMGSATDDPMLQRVTVLTVQQPTPKFALINSLIAGLDVDRFDYVLVVDDDIHVQPGFLSAFLLRQRAFGFALAQPARAWHSYFDHSFALRRPWLAARQTRFVECGPLVSFSRDAARLLIPFHAESEMWGMDLVWPVALERAGLTLGIVDEIAVDHSVRGQATSYDRSTELAAMSDFLARTPHIASEDVFKVVKRFRPSDRTRYL